MLSDLNVLEASTNPATRFCGQMFAANGARVTRVVTDADPGAGEDPHSRDYLDAGKHLVHGDADLPGLLAHADVVVADPDFAWSLIPSGTTTRGPVTGTVDTFGPTGPYADWQATEAVLCSLGGATIYTQSRDKRPVYGFGDRFQYLTGVYLYTALVSCLLQPGAREATPSVRVSAFEAVVSLLPYPTTQYEYNGTLSVLEQSGPRFVCRCRDGFVVVYAGLTWSDIASVLDRADLTHDPRFEAPEARFAHVDDLVALFDEWCAGHTMAQAISAGERHNVAICSVLSPEQVLADSDLAARDAWRHLGEPAGAGRVPQLPYTVDGHRAMAMVEAAR